MCNTKIGTFCNSHDNWRDLLTAEPYNLKIKEDGNYVMFSYDQIRSNFNIELVREARGIIFVKNRWNKPVCWAFNKFCNYGESYAPEIDWETAFVTEKIDGSLMKVWYDCGWHVSTNGTIDAAKAEINNVKVSNFREYFELALKKHYYSFDEFTSNLDEEFTYMFELVGPYNRVVVPYDEPELYFLGARENQHGTEWRCRSIYAGALGLGRFKCPEEYTIHTLEECIKVTEKYSWDKEGFVVVDVKGNRVKVKSPAYVLAHYARNNNVITRKYLIKIILMNEVSEFLCYASDYKDELIKTQRLMKAYHNVGNKLAEACRQTATILHRGDYARMVKALPEIYHGLLFMNYDRDVTAEEYTSKWNENKWEEYLDAMESLNKEILGSQTV